MSSRRTIVPGASLALVLALTGCSSTPTPSASGSGSAAGTATAKASPSASGTTKQGTLDALKAGTGAARELKDGTCTAAGDQWSLKGSITNVAKEAMVYSVSASIVTTKGNQVTARKSLDLKIGAGESAAVKLDKFAQATAADHMCTIRVVKNKA